PGRLFRQCLSRWHPLQSTILQPTPMDEVHASGWTWRWRSLDRKDTCKGYLVHPLANYLYCLPLHHLPDVFCICVWTSNRVSTTRLAIPSTMSMNSRGIPSRSGVGRKVRHSFEMSFDQ